MTLVIGITMDLLWRNALGAIPLAVAVAIICRFIKCRPSTRHALWFIVLIALLAPPLLPSLDFSDDLGAPGYFGSLAKARENESPAAFGGKASPMGGSDWARPRSSDFARQTDVAPMPSLANSVVSSDSDNSVHNSSSQSFNTPDSAAQLPTLEIAASTASERSPTVLRPSASHPNSSPTSISTEISSAFGQVDAEYSNDQAAIVRPTAPAGSDCESPVASLALRPPAIRPFKEWLPAFGRTNATEQATAQPELIAHEPSAIVTPIQSAPDQALPKVNSQTESASSISAPPAASATAVEWRNWLMRLAATRDSIVMLAPIPTTLWLAGVAIISLVMIVRVWRFRRLLRTAWPAEREEVELVRDCADAIGLRWTPHVWMTDRPLSPLVWCGLRRLLILPTTLWNDLDDTGRRTVLLHELAHLKRRDHWVCWIELIACTLCWWNPMAWWVRHRLRDEADYCCDAWVTALLPQSRTAYARALVTTRQFLTLNPSRTEASPPAPPGLALGATSARTKRFARRLTMVMTDRSTPRMSAGGSALALCLVAGAWLATPLWACPPEEQSAQSAAAVAATKDKSAAKAGKAAVAPKATKNSVQVPHVVVAPSGPATIASTEAGSTYEQHMAARADQHAHEVTVAQAAPSARGMVSGTVARSGGDDGMEGRIDRLEARMDRLTAQLERLLGGGGIAGGGQAWAGQDAPPAHSAPAARAGRAVSPRAPSQPAPPQPPVAPAPPAGMSGGMARAMAPGVAGLGGGGMIAAGEVISQDGEEMVVFYALDGDKAAALFEFMRRDDIPVLVAQRDDGIEVHGNAQQQRVFAAFIKLINPESKSQGMGPAGEAAEARAAALSDEARTHAMREAEMSAQRGQWAATEARAADARAQIERARAQMQRQQQQQVEQAHRSLDQQRKQIEQQRERAQKQVEELQKQAEKLQQKAEQLQEKAQELKEGPEKDQMIAQADAIEAQADALEAQADAQEEQLDAQIEALESQLEAQADALESQIEAQQEALESQLEAQVEALESALAKAAEQVPEVADAPAPAEAPTTPSPRP